jgi:hypothetical protein
MLSLFKKGPKKEAKCCTIQIDEVKEDCCTSEEKQACCSDYQATDCFKAN